MNSDKVSVYAVGDVRPNPQLYTYTTNKKISPEKVSALTHAGFDVMSFANNHHLDRGEEAFFETIETLTRNNIAVVGVGRNIDEARKPLILERKGTKVAFLAYCSVLPKGYDARPDKSGCAPMRASTFYEQVDWQPGTAPKIVTLADKDDLAAMVDDIKKVRPLADVVMMSIHWGIHYAPAVIAMYQKEVGYAAIDAGVDLILGHHAHILKGIEMYKGKAIFYSLCNFIMPEKKWYGSLARMRNNVKPDPEYPYYPYPVDSRKTIIAKCIISNKKIERVSFFPVLINKQAQPEVMRRKDKGFDEVLGYMKEITESQGLNAKYQVDGDEVAIHT
ncbi:MAG: CapA family protein [Deltaproteobacteria bacterium]|nr:CapA family protein [Deltaproteobacteria bacterium]